MRGSATPESFLAGLAGDGSLAGPSIAVVVAHPDDETIGVGAQLPRMPGVTIVHVTDGAPRRRDAAARQGFESAEAYAAARRRELEAAMALVGVPPCSLLSLGIADQDAARHMVGLARRLARLFAERNIAVVLTHAYEGGHPDHDADGLRGAVRPSRLAARLIGREPLVVEMPLYHASTRGLGHAGLRRTRRRPPCRSGSTTAQRALKARLYAAHASQPGCSTALPIVVERFRHAPDHDFTCSERRRISSTSARTGVSPARPGASRLPRPRRPCGRIWREADDPQRRLSVRARRPRCRRRRRADPGHLDAALARAGHRSLVVACEGSRVARRAGPGAALRRASSTRAPAGRA